MNTLEPVCLNDVQFPRRFESLSWCSAGCKHWTWRDLHSDQNNMKLSNTLQRETVIHEHLEFW